MSARPAALLLAGLACASLPALAETRTVAGSALVLTAAGSQDVTIGTDPSLVGRVRISLEGSLDCLSVVQGGTAVISTADCADDAGDLRIDVPPSAPVTLTSQGEGTISVADLHAPLVASLLGSGDLHAGAALGLVVTIRGNGAVTAGDIDGALSVESTGNGDVHIKRLRGVLSMRQRGATELVIGAIDAGNVALDAAGSGDMLLGGGNIGSLQVRIAGSSNLSVAAKVHDAIVSASGGGDVRLVKVTGHVQRSASDGSTIVVGGADTRSEVIGEVARKIGDASSADVTIGTHSSKGPGMDHFLMIIVAGIVLYIVFRIVRNSGGIAGFRARAGRAPTAGPTNPSVIALCETMTRLDQRLGRLEGYVTTREFDLNRKFREMGS